jgi:2-(1,2-epoxy-1,2-dihydrophenyl)acetyl-CoA isomerase
LILLGRTFSPDDAVSWGITGQVVPRSEVADTAAGLAEELALGPTAAYAESKRLLREGLESSLTEALVAETAAQNRCGQTQDHRSAVRSFLARERPTFTGQ